MAPNGRTVRLVAGGDVMLGRLVGRAIARHGPKYPLGALAGLLRGADLALVNLECAITASTARWPGAPKAFYFGAPPAAIDALTDAGIGLVSLANNHVLDFGVAGLRDTRRALHEHGIQAAGAGNNIAEAAAPVIVERGGIRFGMVALCDHQADFSAQRARPGMAYMDLTDECAALSVFETRLAALREKGADWPILSLHWGPNMVLRPSPRFQRLAHGAIAMGWKILFGHSAHVYQGVELYRGCPILYAAGDLVDDYAVDPELRNDRQLLFDMELSRTALRRIRLHPVWIDACQARPAAPDMAKAIIDRMALLCGELNTRIERSDGESWISAE
ncbi:CapA family protein [Massilia sp. R2A-15]|uniref:CapA family protein n=1 Tax=Massilia sp. R2A-15 TaxID=3064278 RepID=UPI0027337AB5|nr:CapA family protein [Massilia sp. R2A-15]WLI90294.1 CapA family protein [Massilia sp. R2A-15]